MCIRDRVVTVKPTASSIYDGAGNVANAKGINTSTYSLSFDGTDDYVVLDNSSSFSFDGDLSVSVWVKADDFDNNVAAVVDMHDGDNGYSIAKKTVVNQLSFVVGDGSDKVEVTTGTLSTGVWYHIVGTNDGTDSKIYVNGNLANSVAQGPVDASSRDLYIGKNFSGNETSFWDGNIDEVAVWNDSLSASEVAEIYNLGQGLDVSVGSGDYTSAANLKGYWNFNTGSGTNIKDLTVWKNAPKVVINEVMYNPAMPLSNGNANTNDEREFIELYNTTPNAIDMSNWSLNKGVSYQDTAFTFPSGTYIPANSYLVIARDSIAYYAKYNVYPTLDWGSWRHLNNGHQNIILKAVSYTHLPLPTIYSV